MTRPLLLKSTIWGCCLSAVAFSCGAQTALKQQIDKINTPAVGLAPLRFLASDDLMGRATMRPEINIAARYISEFFRSIGAREVPGTIDYYQNFSLKASIPAKTGSFTVGTKKYEIGVDLLQQGGGNVELTAPVIYAGAATKDDLDKLDLAGKIVVTDMGGQPAAAKQKEVQAKGALALVERFKQTNQSWDAIKARAGRGGGRAAADDGTPAFGLFMVNDIDDVLPALLKSQPVSGTLAAPGEIKLTPVKNVMAWVEGTDPKLKDQFVVLTAHYDHLGVLAKPKMEEGKMDSIYNGARDNAIGTAAVMDAARYFALHPAKRSMLFIAYTGEEIGELGSRYFAAHPTIPLNKLVYNLNIDNASYNDTTLVSVIGLGRTSADEDIKKACAAYGLTALPDPAPEQNLFDRSDNTNLAVKGIPSPTFSLGMRKFDETINNRYHQLSDEVGNFDLHYAMKYINSFILAAKYIGDNPVQPFWDKGDKYEPAWKALYNK